MGNQKGLHQINFKENKYSVLRKNEVIELKTETEICQAFSIKEKVKIKPKGELQ